MKNNYLLESNDYIAIHKKQEEIIKINKFDNATISIYDMDNETLVKPLEDLDTYGFFSEKKVIIIRNIDSLKIDENKSDIEHLLKYIDNYNKDNLLIICAKKLNNTLKLTKELKKKCEYLKVEVNTLDYIKNELKEYKLETGVINLLNSYCNDDITKISNECSKLKTYKFDEKYISKNDVLENVVKKQEDLTELTFDFVKCLAQKDKKDALKKYKELENNEVEPLSLIGLLASQIRIIYQVKVLNKKRLSIDEITNILGEKSSYRVKKTKELISYYSEEELLDLMKRLADIDLKIKTSDVDGRFLIEMFILNI